MRERAADVKAQRDALQRRETVLSEVLRAVTNQSGDARRGEVAYRGTRKYTDATCGEASKVASLINPTLAHGGLVMVETFYAGSRDVECYYLDDWRSTFRRMIESGCSSAWVWAEQSLIDELSCEASERQNVAWGRTA